MIRLDKNHIRRIFFIYKNAINVIAVIIGMKLRLQLDQAQKKRVATAIWLLLLLDKRV
jgi:hypothetical protein